MKKFVRFSLIALTSIALVGCGDPTTESQITTSSDTTTTTTPTTPSTPSTETPDTPKVVTYALHVEAEEGIVVTVENSNEDSAYEAGTELSFTVSETVSNKKVTHVSFNGVEISANSEKKYVVTMPKKESTIKVDSVSLGEDNLLEEKEVTAEMVPTTVEGVVQALKEAAAVEGKYFSYGTYSNNPKDSYDKVFDYEITAYQNDILQVKGTEKASKSNSFTTSYIEERGIAYNRYYDYVYGSGSYGNNDISGSYDESLRLFNLVSDDQKDVNENLEIKESAAKSNSTSYGFASILLGEYFKEGYYEDGFVAGQWKNVMVSSVVSSDKKSFTTTLTANYDNYSNMEFNTLTLSFDGTNFLTSASFVGEEYDYDDFDNETNLPKENATVVESESVDIVSHKGYKQLAEETIDVKDFVMHDYDVNLSYKHTGDESTTVVNDSGIVEVGSYISYEIQSNDDTKNLIKPIPMGAKEEGFVEVIGSSFHVLKEGDFTLCFDNGAGEIKEIPLHANIPDAKKIEAKAASDFVFVGNSTVVSATVLPEGSLQNYVVTKKDSSVGDVEIIALDDGTYSVKGTKVGSVDLLVQATGFEDVSTELTIQVEAKPEYNVLMENLKTMTMKGSDGDGVIYINFGEDGQGQYRYGEKSYWGDSFNFQSIYNFTYTLDPDTLEFTYNCTDSPSYGDVTITSISVLTNNKIHIVAEKYSSFEMDLSTVDRVDLSTLG